jgi:hypothetical protein
MNNPDPPAEPDAAQLAIEAVSRALADARAVLEGMEDPDVAFKRATELGAVLRDALDDNAQVRSLLVYRIWEKHQLDLAVLGKRISVSKSRAFQLLQAGRAQEEEQEKES